jgi:hypothetical protein
MDLLVTVTATDGRLTGTARSSGTDVVVAFSGSLELLACLERLAAGETAHRPLPDPLPAALTAPLTAPVTASLTAPVTASLTEPVTAPLVTKGR